ncbi:SURF1 family cytochrome oxidase biogenesis protein [Sphingomonas sp. R86520]|uniref:SURF1 family cytochrome oxidase biogenesis protein n=1 Tax=Sphingomonas sp. R86520 TaxID=3093859 RepID=UPI0036D34A34
MTRPARRVPIIPTILVTLAIAAMIALGLWQLIDRLPKKEAFLVQLAANPAKPPMAFPRVPDEALLFRRATGVCLQPTGITLAGAGKFGFRAIAQCRTGADGPGMIVQLGTTRDPMAKIAWAGGEVSGYISHAPDGRSLIGSLFAHSAQRLMLVADTPQAGLSPNGRPDIATVPNNHLAYAGQWFFFAAIAAIIYTLALRRRPRTAPSPR